MTMRDYYIGVFTGLLVAAIIVNFFPEPKQTCEEARVELWAHGQCLKFRPACPISHEKFMRIYELKGIVKQCPEDDGNDLQLQLHKSN